MGREGWIICCSVKAASVEPFTHLERAVIEKLLMGDHPVLAVLRQQYERAKLLNREVTAVGFFANIQVPDDLPRAHLNPRSHLSDVAATIPRLRNPAGFILFITDGALDFLEGYTHDEPWPSDAEVFTLQYLKVPRDLSLFDERGKSP
jgi:hypothetical protein